MTSTDHVVGGRSPAVSGPTAASADTDDEVVGRWLLRRLREWWPLVVLAVAITGVAVLTAVQPDTGLPLDPASTGPDGTRALVDVLAAVGHPVDVVDPGDIADADVVLLLRDQLTDAQHEALRRRVRDGARVVVADPESELAPQDPVPVGFLDRVLTRGCDVPALRDVREVRPTGGVVYPVPDGGTGCFATAEGAWLVIEPLGRGHIVSLGGPDVLVNSTLGRADHAVLTAQLLAPSGHGSIAVVRPVLRTAGDDVSLVDLVPPGVRVMVLQLLVAFVVLVVWRARRLGPPLVETTSVTLANAEQTSAVGALLARNGARAAAVRRIAGDTRLRLARRLGLHGGSGVEEIAAAVAERTGQDGAAVAATLEPATPTDDADLLRATVDLAQLERDVAATLSPNREHTDVH